MTPLVGFRSRIEQQLERLTYISNVFLMMKFRPSNKLVSDFILSELKSHGLNGVRADDPEWNLTRNVFNPLAVLYCCRFGLALFDEPEQGQAYSPNVAYELGVMHLQNKPCLILKHNSLPPVPFDLVKDLHYEYSSDLQLRGIIAEWVKSLKAEALTSAFDVMPERQIVRGIGSAGTSIPLAESDPAMHILCTLALLGEAVYPAEKIAEKAGEPIVKVRYYLDALKELGYVETGIVAESSGTHYKLSKQGVETIIQQGAL